MGQGRTDADYTPTITCPSRQAKRLQRNNYDVTIISPTGYFAFTPLLASTSVGTLEYRVALESVRRLTGVNLILGRARELDIETNRLIVASGVPNPAKSQWSTSAPPRALGSPFQDEVKGREAEGGAEEELFAMEYDKLVVSVGAFSATFGTPGARPSVLALLPSVLLLTRPLLAAGLRARSLLEGRSRRPSHPKAVSPFSHGSSDTQILILSMCLIQNPRLLRASFRAFRQGEGEAGARLLPNCRWRTHCTSGRPLHTTTPELTSAVVAHLQGVEFAAELHDLISSDMKKHYPELAQMATITLYDVAPGILLSFEENLRRYAMNTFAREQVIVRPNSKVNRVGDGWMEIEGEGKS